jgi:hypothetical protein
MPVTDPKTVKNRVHLDLTSSAANRDQEIDRLLAHALGSRDHHARSSLCLRPMRTPACGIEGYQRTPGNRGAWLL